MTLPMRVQRTRIRDSHLPPNTICVTRPGPFSNPLRVGRLKGYTAAHAVADFQLWLDRDTSVRSFENVFGAPPTAEKIRHHLGGHNLACWCRLCPEHAAGRPLGVTCLNCEPCHVDVLLPRANP